jgi:hypothetical protein
MPLDVIKSFKGFKANTIFCRDSDRKLLSKPEKVKNRWVEYFNVLLNTTEDRDDEMEWTEDNLTDPGVKIDVEGLIPDEDDMDTAILRQRNNKAFGTDGIAVDLFKANEAIKKEIHKLTVKFWRTEQIPQD